ncbi:MAG: chorismate-binding protein [Muribaculaceae bacterium]|nr:chorismate-binding protein [Muribaculaceae bacterium]
MLSTSLLNSLTDKEVIDYALKHNCSFALYRMPGRTSVTLCMSQQLMEDFDFPSEGFIIAPFANDNQRIIPNEYSRMIDCRNYVELNEQFFGQVSERSASPMPEEYYQSVSTIINRLKADGGKTVFSTLHCGTCPLDIYDAFIKLTLTYPDAFVFCFKLKDEEHAWLGATPEVLIEVADNKLLTMALAGTRLADKHDEPWGDKNIKEQAMVTEFITEKMKEAGLEVHLTDAYSRTAGNIEHICTELTSILPLRFDLKSFLKELPPTPAVSGLPRDIALGDIARLEPHNREYYAGYCGPATASHVSLYVTLRCMSVDPSTHKCTLYAGGGITAQSEPESEWREVNAKAATLAGPLGITLHNSF